VGFQVIWEFNDDEEDVPISRRELAKKIGCHFNTLRQDELLIKQWVNDAADYYRSNNPKKLESVPLDAYLVWLILQVRSLRKKGYSTDAVTKELFIDNPDKYSKQGFEYYVYQQSFNRQTRSTQAA
jgi:hypothetical protein